MTERKNIMAKNPKTKRTTIKDISVAEKKMTKEEMEKLKGGGKSIPGLDIIVKPTTGGNR